MTAMTTDIRGDGYGSSHNWERNITDLFGGEKGTRYFCRGCGACFVHTYDLEPDIFKAMRDRDVHDICGAVVDRVDGAA